MINWLWEKLKENKISSIIIIVLMVIIFLLCIQHQNVISYDVEGFKKQNDNHFNKTISDITELKQSIEQIDDIAICLEKDADKTNVNVNKIEEDIKKNNKKRNKNLIKFSNKIVKKLNLVADKITKKQCDKTLIVTVGEIVPCDGILTSQAVYNGLVSNADASDNYKKEIDNLVLKDKDKSESLKKIVISSEETIAKLTQDNNELKNDSNYCQDKLKDCKTKLENDFFLLNKNFWYGVGVGAGIITVIGGSAMLIMFTK